MRVSTALFQDLATNRILDQQSRLSDIQEKVATGKRIVTPSDDPAGATRVLNLAKSIDTIESYNRNIGFAESRMGVEESVLSEVGNVINRVRELTVQANNASNSAEDRRKIGAEVRERLDQLVALANSTDGNGEYLFAGNSSRTEPFVRQSGTYAYQGDQGSREIQVGPNRRVETTHTGFEVFMDIETGNGEYVSDADAGNNGTGVISGVQINDATTPKNPGYTIDFSETPGGQLQYTVTDGTGASTGPTNYDPENPITFDDLEVTFDGTPADGDSFTVDEARPQSLFDTVENLAEALENSTDGSAGQAASVNQGNQALDSLDNATENLLSVRAELGGRLNRLEQEREANSAAVLELKGSRSKTEDLDYAEAVTELNQRLLGLRAAQQSYTKIQGLSLFNYL